MTCLFFTNIKGNIIGVKLWRKLENLKIKVKNIVQSPFLYVILFWNQIDVTEQVLTFFEVSFLLFDLIKETKE